MTSIYRRALGGDFERLHPRIQERFGLTSAAGRAAVGTGVMEALWHGPLYTLPFLLLFSGIAEVCEWYDEPSRRYRIDVAVSNSTWGPLFGYCGWFDVAWTPVEPGGVPAHVKPRREESRE